MKNRQDFIEHVLSCFPDEACGVEVHGVYVPCENISDDPLTSFEIDPVILDRYDAQIDLIWHSHTKATSETFGLDPRVPSASDMRSQLACAVPFGIVYCDGQEVSEPIIIGDPENRPPLTEREFIFNANDCLTLAADYLYQEHKILLPSCPRDWDWFAQGETLIDDHWRDWGFYEVPITEAQKSDVLLFRMRADFTNHIGVYLGGNDVLHHMIGKLSGVDELASWRKYLYKVIRHKDIK